MINMINKILRVLLKYSVIFLIASIIGDHDIITSAFADSEDETEENPPKKNKGKERAYFPEEAADSSEQGQNLEEDLEEAGINKQVQEAYDFELAKRLQDEEYELSNSRLHQAKSETSSEYTVYSSEIHESDSESVKKAKLSVKEAEKSLKLSDAYDIEQSSKKK